MNQPDPSARPSQVTVAGWAVAVASVLLVLAVFSAIGQLESVDMRDRLSHAVSSGSLKDLGFSVGDALDVVRWCLYISGVAAAVSGVLGVFVLQGHRAARVVLTVAAVAIVLTSSVTGSFPAFLGMFIAVGTGLLWSRPARDWFAGRPVARPQARQVAPPAGLPAPPVREQAPPVSWAPPAPGSARPPPMPGWGHVPGAVPPALHPFRPVAPRARPPQVRLACILTWVFAGATALGYTAVLLMLLVDRSRLIEELKKSPGWKSSFDADTVTAVAAVASCLFVAWSVAAIVLAALTWRRVRWAWIVLLVSAWAAGLLSVLAFPFSLPYLAAIGVSTGLLMRRPTRQWFADEPRPGPWPGPYSGPYSGPPPGPPPGPSSGPPSGQQPPAPRPPVW